MALPQVGWELEPIIPSLGGVLLAGAPGSLKTTLALATVRRGLERGREAFLWVEEEHPKVLQERLQQLRVGVSPHPSLMIAHRRGLTLTEAVVSDLGQLLRAASDPVLVIDNLSLVNAGDENSTKDSADFVRMLKRLQLANDNLLLLLLHHDGKGSWDGKRRGSARGSTAFPAWSDSHIELTKVAANEEHVMVDVQVERHKFAPEPPRQRVTITMGDGTCSVTDAPGVLRKAIERAPAAPPAIVSVLREHGPMSMSSVLRHTKGNKGTVFAEIRRLIEAGELETAGSGPTSVVRVAGGAT